MNNCPRVLMSRSQHPHQAGKQSPGLNGREGALRRANNVPLHVVPYRVEGRFSGRHVVGASLASLDVAGKVTRLRAGSSTTESHTSDSRSLTSLEDQGPRPGVAVAACLRLCVAAAGGTASAYWSRRQTSSNAPRGAVGRLVPIGVE